MRLSTRLDRLQRLIGTGFCFAIFGVGALTIATFLIPVGKLFYSPKKKNIYARNVVHLSWRFFVFVMSSLNLISITTKDFEKLKEMRGKIIVANHPSLIDIVILISFVPQADCIVKGSLSRNFFMRGIVNSIYIPNSNDVEKLFNDCTNSLQQGNNLIIFPEGTRTIPGQKSTLSRSAAYIAIKSQSNILPIRINCNPPWLLKNQKWHEVASEKLNYTLEALAVIKVSEYLDRHQEHRIAARRLTEEMERVLF